MIISKFSPKIQDKLNSLGEKELLDVIVVVVPHKSPKGTKKTRSLEGVEKETQESVKGLISYLEKQKDAGSEIKYFHNPLFDGIKLVAPACIIKNLSELNDVVKIHEDFTVRKM